MDEQRNHPAFLGPPWTKVWEWNDGNNAMDLERVLHPKWNRTPMAVVKRLIFILFFHRGLPVYLVIVFVSNTSNVLFKRIPVISYA